jgi:formate dehydrogenase subunit gamma
MKDAAAHAAWDVALARTIIGAAEPAQHALLPLLHIIQATFGYIDREAEPLIAEALNISRADVHGVVTFYHDFRHEPPARHILRVCHAEACQARGSDALTDEIAAGLGTVIDTTTADGAVSFEAVYCLGLCASGPAIMLDGKLVGRVEPGEGARRVIEACRQ